MNPVPRSALFDNLKGLLIFLVVFGHMLESQTGQAANFLYLAIYSFHMPAFIFISGWFSRHGSLKKTITHVLLPYLIFQTLYLLYMGQPLQFHSPYWILWYLFALFVWRLILPVLRWKRAVAPLLLPVSVVVSLVCGYTDLVGYTFALSRVLVFFPYFLLGFWLSGLGDQLLPKLRTGLSRAGSLCGVLACLTLFFIVRQQFMRQWMFGAFTYAFTGSSPQIRLLLLGTAVLWLWFLLSWMPTGRLPGLSALGRNTLFVYLLHGFVKLPIDAHADLIYRFGTWGNIALAFGLALGLTALFGNVWLARTWKKATAILRPRSKTLPV